MISQSVYYVTPENMVLVLAQQAKRLAVPNVHEVPFHPSMEASSARCALQENLVFRMGKW